MRKLRRPPGSRGPARHRHPPWQLQRSACAARTMHSAPCDPLMGPVLSSKTWQKTGIYEMPQLAMEASGLPL